MLIAGARRLKVRRGLGITVDGLRGRRWTLQTENLGASSAGLHNLLIHAGVAKLVLYFLFRIPPVHALRLDLRRRRISSCIFIHFHEYLCMNVPRGKMALSGPLMPYEA